MVSYNFKEIHVVPDGPQLIDIVLSRTQRKTATVVHARYDTNRIRRFYMDKINYTSKGFTDRLKQVIDDFPRLDDIHPFYAAILNVLYDRDHYKIALGQINVAKQIVDSICKDYVKMLKYASSLYRAKTLKRAALGRMVTCVKKHDKALQFLERVRQHMSRLPSINPYERAILLTGYPNVGKSSFTNLVTRADVEENEYAFTTKSLFVGHAMHNYGRYQVIDSPGLLDRDLDDRNKAEMLGITALVYLDATVLFLFDMSDNIERQVGLFRQIHDMFESKPIMLVLNKIDAVLPEGGLATLPARPTVFADAQSGMDWHQSVVTRVLERLPAGDADLLRGLFQQLAGAQKTFRVMAMSNRGEFNVTEVKNTACSMILESRSSRVPTGRLQRLAGRVTVTQPIKRDTKTRGANIPQSVLDRRAGAAAMDVDDDDAVHRDDDTYALGAAAASATAGMVTASGERKTYRQIEEENGGAGVYQFNLRTHWELEDPQQAEDAIPDIFMGENVADWVTPDIRQKLEALEAQEEQLVSQWTDEMAAMGEDVGFELDEDGEMLLEEIRDKRHAKEANHFVARNRNAPILPRKARRRTVSTLVSHLNELGVVTDKLETRIDGVRQEVAAKAIAGRKRRRKDAAAAAAAGADEDGDAPMDVDGDSDEYHPPTKRQKLPESLEVAAAKMKRLDWKSQRTLAKSGPGDHHIPTLRPKFLNTGKRRLGSTDWR